MQRSLRLRYALNNHVVTTERERQTKTKHARCLFDCTHTRVDRWMDGWLLAVDGMDALSNDERATTTLS